MRNTKKALAVLIMFVLLVSAVVLRNLEGVSAFENEDSSGSSESTTNNASQASSVLEAIPANTQNNSTQIDIEELNASGIIGLPAVINGVLNKVSQVTTNAVIEKDGARQDIEFISYTTDDAESSYAIIDVEGVRVAVYAPIPASEAQKNAYWQVIERAKQKAKEIYDKKERKHFADNICNEFLSEQLDKNLEKVKSINLYDIYLNSSKNSVFLNNLIKSQVNDYRTAMALEIINSKDERENWKDEIKQISALSDEHIINEHIDAFQKLTLYDGYLLLIKNLHLSSEKNEQIQGVPFSDQTIKNSINYCIYNVLVEALQIDRATLRGVSEDVYRWFQEGVIR